jgi:putative ATP-dependent endonuclease of OLD family
MEIKKIKIKNFRSIGEEGINFEPKDRLNIIVGENNVGKSNILKALKLLVDTLEEKHKEISEIEWHNGVTEREFEISIEFILNKEDLDMANQNLTKAITDNETKINRLKKDFGEKVEIIMSHKKSNNLWDSILFKWGILYLNRSNEGFLNLKDKNRSSHPVVDWTGILSNYIDESDEKSINNVIEERLQEREDSVIGFVHPVYPIFMTAFKENFKLFEDIRQKPIGKGSDALESFDGELVADVLFNLSTGYHPRRRKYKSIQEKFGALFPNLELAAVQDKTSRKPDIHVIKKTTNYEGSLNSMGTGIIEIVIFLTNIMASKNKVLGIEDPELHLHPHAQRLLFEILQEYGDNKQLFVITHSPLFIDVKRIDSLILIREGKGGTTAKQFSPLRNATHNPEF